jgi:hypothetical protein
MQATIDALITYSYKPNRFSIRVQSRIDPRISFLVPMEYCPFCGTRINEEWVRSFYKPVSMASKLPQKKLARSTG